MRTAIIGSGLIGQAWAIVFARAGCDVKLWDGNSEALGKASGPQWLSTHPASSTRIKALENYAAQLQPLYQQGRTQGKQPDCKRS